MAGIDQNELDELPKILESFSRSSYKFCYESGTYVSAFFLSPPSPEQILIRRFIEVHKVIGGFDEFGGRRFAK